jgi:dnd system-associated protein 4
MRRIQRAIDKEEVVKRLAAGDNGVFKEIWRVLIFAAFLGHKLGKRIPLEAVEAGKSIDEGVFANNRAWPGILYLLSIIEINSPEALCNTDDISETRIKLFEEYANGGLAYLKEKLEPQSYALESILNLIRENTMPQVSMETIKLRILLSKITRLWKDSYS